MSIVANLLPALRAVDNTKYARATLVAQALGYNATLSPDESFDELYARTQGDFRSLLSDINEYIYVDVNLAQNLYKALLQHRYDLLTSAVSPELVHMALTAQSQKDLLSREQVLELQSLIQGNAYQAQVLQLMGILATQSPGGE